MKSIRSSNTTDYELWLRWRTDGHDGFMAYKRVCMKKIVKLKYCNNVIFVNKMYSCKQFAPLLKLSHI